MTGGTFVVKPGSLFPALHRMEEEGWTSSFWGDSENNRRAKYDRLTKAGRRQLEAESKQLRQDFLGHRSSFGSVVNSCRGAVCRFSRKLQVFCEIYF